MLFEGYMEYFKPWTLFWIMQLIGLTIFAGGMLAHLWFILKGRQASTYRRINLPVVIKTFWWEVIWQRQLYRQERKRWLMHFSIFAGFTGLCFLSFLQSTNEIFLNHRFDFSNYPWKGFLGDLFGFLLLLGLLMAVNRRFRQKLPQLRQLLDDKIAVLLLLLLVVTGFLLRSLPMALGANDPSHKASYFSLLLAGLWQMIIPLINFTPPVWQSLLTGLWVFHAFLNAVFLSYFPFSKLIHIVFTPVELLLNAVEEYDRRDIYG